MRYFKCFQNLFLIIQTTLRYETDTTSTLRNTLSLKVKLDNLTSEIQGLTNKTKQLRVNQVANQVEAEKIIQDCHTDNQQRANLIDQLISTNQELDSIEENLAIAENWNSSYLQRYEQRINALSQQLTRADARIRDLSNEKDKLDITTRNAFAFLTELRIQDQSINQAQTFLSSPCMNFPIIAEGRQVQGQ